jgi:pimeloyl-ACP methyl ester carboxylesterase
MIADQMIGELKGFAEKEYDVYVYDYRGYGTSEGKRRIKAMIEDYKEIIPFLNEQYEINLLYGISLGAAILTNAIGSGVHYDRAVIDSSLSRFSDYGCPKEIDPINNLPEDASNILVITGQMDGVLKPTMTSEFRLLAKRKGAKVFNSEHYAHPFMDRNPSTHQDRMRRVIDFLNSSGNYSTFKSFNRNKSGG